MSFKKNYLYDIVILSDRTNNKYFVAKISAYSKMYGRMLVDSYLSFVNEEGEFVHVKVHNHVERYGIQSLTVTRKNSLVEKKVAEQMVYGIQTSLISQHGEDCILNNVIVNPKTVICECGMTIKEQFLEAHKEKHCSGPAETGLDDLIKEQMILSKHVNSSVTSFSEKESPRQTQPMIEQQFVNEHNRVRDKLNRERGSQFSRQAYPISQSSQRR